ncbi:MAG: SIS domain-containing protein [Planctomycetaceae bacterium]|nr:SIS domain-containing protein [Planctomycetota bacterium]NUN51629.1 SIS domain-containing protein [Planctomycetaceae bacterium]
MGSRPLHPLDAIYDELTDIARALPRDQADALATAVKDARRVFVGGMGRSGLMVRAFAMRLMQLGVTVYVVGETTTPSIAKGDLLVVGSRFGRSGSLSHYVEIARREGARVAVVTMDPATPLAEMADIVATIPVAEGGPSRQPMGTLFEQSLLVYLDAVVLLLKRLLRKTEDAMKKRHTNLE